jgi:hypothetical protein
MLVDGVVLIPAEVPPFRSATVRVRLLDVSLADAPSTVLAEQTVLNVGRPAQQEQAVPFTLQADLPTDWRGTLVVSSHVDVVGDGAVHPGDCVTTRSYPVPPEGGGGYVVRCEQVR